MERAVVTSDPAHRTLGYAFQLALLVDTTGWTVGAERSLCQLACRIALWHDGGMGGGWS